MGRSRGKSGGAGSLGEVSRQMARDLHGSNSIGAWWSRWTGRLGDIVPIVRKVTTMWTNLLRVTNWYPSRSGSGVAILGTLRGRRASRVGFAILLVVSASGTSAAGTIYWNMQTAAVTSSSLVGVLVDDLKQGNNNGTTPMLSSTSAATTSSYSFVLDGVSTVASAGSNAQAAARVGGLNIASGGSAYFEFTIRPTFGSLTITGLGFGSRSTSTGPKAWTLRSEADSYGANLVTPGVLANDSAWAYRTAALMPPLTIPQDTPRTFRIYGYGGEGSIGANAANWRIDDLQVVPEPAAGVLVSAGLGALLLRARRRRRPTSDCRAAPAESPSTRRADLAGR